MCVVVCRYLSPCKQGVQQRETPNSNKPMETITEQGMEELPSHTLLHLHGQDGLGDCFVNLVILPISELGCNDSFSS